MQAPRKALPPNLSRTQSRSLVFVVGGIIITSFLLPLPFLFKHHQSVVLELAAGVVALTFGLLVWALRAATPAAAVFGGLICQLLIVWTETARGSVIRSALTPLVLLFVLTFLATRLGKKRRPDFTSEVERRRGRTASQVIANLGVTPLVIVVGMAGWFDLASRGRGIVSAEPYATPALVLAALAEATADTISSEFGQAFGGTPWLLTTLRPSPVGTDGAVSLLGTASGMAAGALVTAAGTWALDLQRIQSYAALAGAIAGLLFDSLLGATAERRGWLNNDLVNFLSTAFAALITLLLLLAL